MTHFAPLLLLLLAILDYHPSFIRGHKFLCLEIKRVQIKAAAQPREGPHVVAKTGPRKNYAIKKPSVQRSNQKMGSKKMSAVEGHYGKMVLPILYPAASIEAKPMKLSPAVLASTQQQEYLQEGRHGNSARRILTLNSNEDSIMSEQEHPAYRQYCADILSSPSQSAALNGKPPVPHRAAGGIDGSPTSSVVISSTSHFKESLIGETGTGAQQCWISSPSSRLPSSTFEQTKNKVDILLGTLSAREERERGYRRSAGCTDREQANLLEPRPIEAMLMDIHVAVAGSTTTTTTTSPPHFDICNHSYSTNDEEPSSPPPRPFAWAAV